jgi:hypothetical protein
VSAAVLVFVNERPVRVAAGADALAAVAARGIPLAPATPVFAGAIFRCVVSARRPRDEADAHA